VQFIDGVIGDEAQRGVDVAGPPGCIEFGDDFCGRGVRQYSLPYSGNAKKKSDKNVNATVAVR
jgi:hypothetical protein